MSGSLTRNLRIFGKICGASPAQKVLFVTTMWDRKPERGEDREKALRGQYLKPMMDLGADMIRFQNDGDLFPLWKRISQLITNDAGTVMLLQEEMVKKRMALRETNVAKILQELLREDLQDQTLSQETRKEIEGMIQDLKLPFSKRIVNFFKGSKGVRIFFKKGFLCS